MLLKPGRLPPLLLTCAHEATTDFHRDWTVVEGSQRNDSVWAVEQRLRELRNKLIRDALLDGRPVWFCSSGCSLHPLIHSGDTCTYMPMRPMRDPETPVIQQGELVFCQVHESQLNYMHLVLRTEWDSSCNEYKYIIGNIKGKESGWVLARHVFGILTRVQYWDDEIKGY